MKNDVQLEIAINKEEDAIEPSLRKHALKHELLVLAELGWRAGERMAN